MFRYLTILLLLYSLRMPPAAAQQYHFRHYQVENGLSNNAVICCLQDKRGFLWFGTKDGLNRFDGYSFKVFRNNPADSGSIGNNFIHCLYEDPGGSIWVGTERGLYRYNPVTEQFQLLPVADNSVIREIRMDRSGNLWFIMNLTLFRYQLQQNRYVAFREELYTQVSAIDVAADGTVWTATPGGYLQRYDPAANRFVAYDLFQQETNYAARWIERICCTRDGHILIGTSTSGALCFDPGRRTCRKLVTYNNDHTELFVRNFLQVTDTTYWIASESGIFIYQTGSGSITNLRKAYNNPFSISDNAVYAFCRDREGGIWACTYFGGLNYFPGQYTPFEKAFPQRGENALSGNVVREIHEDRFGNLWIGTEDAGLNRLDKKTGLFTSYQPTGQQTALAYTNIHGMLTDSDRLWVGTFEHGLDVLHMPTGKVIRHYQAGTGAYALRSNFIYCINRLQDGSIVIGTTIGAYRYNRQHDGFEPLYDLPLNNWYAYLLQDHAGVIWAATYGNGVRYHDPQTGKSGQLTRSGQAPYGISSDRVNSLFEDSHHQLWLATENGLTRLDQKRHQSKTYTTADGLPANFILSILEDDRQHLWVSTSKGLFSLDLRTDHIKVYTSIHGTINDQFNFNSACKDAAGRLYFGSVKGLIRFDPTTFSENSFVPPVYITGFQVFNKELPVSRNGSPLRQSISYTDTVVLPYDASSISIDFAALSFTAPEMSEYAYRMTGLDTGWIYLKRNRKAFFTNLKPGTYTFEVKASNSSGRWNQQPRTLMIEIRPPWWLSNWAYLGYTLLGLLFVYFSTRLYRRSVEVKNQRKYELLQIAREKEIVLAKIEFFTSVAHEIKTPLSLIKAPLERVIQKAGDLPGMASHLKIMDRNTNRLIELTNQLLDFRQTEIHHFKLDFVHASISELLEEIFASFKPLAEQHHIQYRLVLPAEAIYAYIDLDAFKKILYNLFSNAVKYASRQVVVSLHSLPENNQHLVIHVKNDGFLIPQDMKEKVFEPFFRLNETIAQKGTGIGLAVARSLAQLHSGRLVLSKPENDLNVFTLTLPLHQQNQPATNALHP